MNEIIQAVLDSDFVVFNEKFKNKLEMEYKENFDEITAEAKKSIFEVAMVADKLCPTCGKFLPIALQGSGSCIYCGNLI